MGRFIALSISGRQLRVRRGDRGGLEMKGKDAEAELAAHRLVGTEDSLLEVCWLLDQVLRENPQCDFSGDLIDSEILQRPVAPNPLELAVRAVMDISSSHGHWSDEVEEMPRPVLEWMVEHRPGYIASSVRDSAARHRLARSHKPVVREYLAHNPHLDQEEVAVLAADSEPRVREVILRHPLMTAELARPLLQELTVSERRGFRSQPAAARWWNSWPKTPIPWCGKGSYAATAWRPSCGGNSRSVLRPRARRSNCLAIRAGAELVQLGVLARRWLTVEARSLEVVEPLAEDEVQGGYRTPTEAPFGTGKRP